MSTSVDDAAKIWSLNYQVLLHLGDVYYAGLESEEKNRFLQYWPSLLNIFPSIVCYFFAGRSTLTARNSSGPLSSRRFRLAFSSSGAAIVRLSIAFAARSARAARCRSEGADFVFTERPSSTSRAMAPERVVSLRLAHSSIVPTVAAGIRADTIGSRPVAGRPRFFFWSTFIDFFMN